MALIANKSFSVANDRVGKEIIHIRSGEIDVEMLGLNPSAIEWMLNEGFADEIGGDTETVSVTETESEPDTEVEESAVEFEIAIDPLKVVDAIDDKVELDKYAAELGIELDRRKSLKNMKADFTKEYKPTVETK